MSDGRNLRRVQRSVEQQRVQSFDVETTGVSPYKGHEIFSFCIGDVNEGVSVYRVDNQDKRENERNWQILRDFFADISIVKLAHLYKFELSFLKCHDIDVPEGTIWHDSMIMAQQLRNLSQSFALDWLTWRWGGDPKGEMRALNVAVRKQAKERGNNYQNVDVSLMTEYQKADGISPLLLFHTWIDTLRADAPLYADYLNEIALVLVTQRMESFGILVDFDNVGKLREWLATELEQVRDATHDILGEYINLNSDDQVARILFGQYKLPILSLTESGKPSTDKDTLLALRAEHNNPLFDLVLKNRSYTKGISTIASYLKYVCSDGIIHPSINTNRARTGRESSSEPNLQNVNNSAAEKNPFPVPLRKCFRARVRRLLFFVDYSGIEMRLIVNETQEPELLDMILADADADLHHPTLECFMMPSLFTFKGDKTWCAGVEAAAALRADDYTRYKVLRRAYKNTGFCIAYAGGTGKVAFTLGKRVEEIQTGDENYRTRFPRIDGFTSSIVERVRRQKYVVTAFGRKLFVPLDKAYSGSNYLIQGTAAGVLKRAQVRVDKWLKCETSDRVRLVLPIHDELVISYPRELMGERHDILTEVSRIMTDMPEIKVPLRVEWKVTTTDWASAKEVDV